MRCYNWSLYSSGYQKFISYSIWALCLLAIFQNNLSLWMKGVLLIIWLIWGMCLRRHHIDYVFCLNFDVFWSFQSCLGQQQSGYQLRSTTAIWRWAVFLSLYCPTSKRRCRIVVSRDQLSQTQFKQLIRVIRNMA